EVAWFIFFGPWIKSLPHPTYSTALDISHEVDRAAAFYIIVLGEYLYNVIVGLSVAIGLNLCALRAVWTLVVAFCLNRPYVNADGAIDSAHPLHRAVWSAFTWILIHLPLNMGLLIGGHICAISVAQDELGSGERWLLGGGLGTGLLVLFIIPFFFWDILILLQIVRIFPRLLVAITLALLPLVPPEELNPTQLLSIAAGLLVFLVL
ncbi:hypothetical protein AOQ84DRAFT_417718, partial [Glonium stellatum]